MAMQYRKLPRGEEMLSTIGLGTSFMHLFSEQQVAELMNVALDGGINVIDFLSHRGKAIENMASTSPMTSIPSSMISMPSNAPSRPISSCWIATISMPPSFPTSTTKRNMAA